MANFTLPPARGLDTPDPAGDINNLTAAHVAAGADLNVFNGAFAGGGDPSVVPDPTPAIQAALNAVPANGAIVKLPPGAYTLSAPLTVSVSGTIIAGSGWGTQLRYDGTVLTSGAIKMADTTQRRVFIRDLRITQTAASSTGAAINASYFTNSVIERVLIDGSTNAPNIGIDFNVTGSYYNVVSDSRINVSGANSIGVRFDTNSNSNVVRNCRIIPDLGLASSIGCYVNARSILLEHLDVESTPGTGISVGPNGHACTIVAPYLEACGTNLALAAGVNAPTVIGGTIEAATTADYADAGALTPMMLNVRSSSGGEHAYTKGLIGNVRQPPDLGLLAWNYDPLFAAASQIAVNGTIYLLGVILRHAALVTNLAVYLGGAAVSPVANQNFLALVDAGGVIRGATAAGAIDASTATSGWLSRAMAASYLAPAGRYWVACLFNAATPPTFARATGQSLGGPDAGQSAANFWVAVNGTTATALPGSFTPSSNTHTGAIAGCVAVS
jgi:hypothetical protein